MTHETLNKWLFYLKDAPSQDLVKTWTFYTMVGAALQRRVWINGGTHFDIFPNMYVIFIGAPGSGKSISSGVAKGLLQSLTEVDASKGAVKTKIRLGPDSLTLEALTRKLANQDMHDWPPEYKKPAGAKYVSSPMAFFSTEELGTLLKKDEHDLVTFLTQGWDCKDFVRETKTQGIDIIKNMCLTLLGCATPEWVRSNVNSKILGEGLASRTVFVYTEKPKSEKYKIVISPEQKAALKDVSSHIEKLTALFGMIDTSEFDAKAEPWFLNEFKPINPDKKLESYYARKKLHLQKLGMCIHFANGFDMKLTAWDFDEAIKLLAVTESDMHKALQSAGTNPIYGLSMEIIQFLKKKDRPLSFREILVHMFDLGDMETINKALEYLRDTKQVSVGTYNNEVSYSVTK